MAKIQSGKTLEKTFDIKCCLCWINRADSYCVICKKFYCEPCTGRHTKYPGMKDHKFVDRVLVEYLGPDGYPPGLPRRRCPKHQSESTNFYCNDVSDSVRFFLVTNRTSCSDICSVPKVTKQKGEIGAKLEEKREIKQ